MRRVRRVVSVQRWRALLRGCAGRAVVFPALLFAAVLIPGIAAADGIGGYLDLGYNNLVSDSQDVLGNSSRTESNSISQRYNLSLSRTLYPNLRLSASGLFDKTNSATTTSGTETESTLTRVQPLVDLTLRSPVYLAGVRYSRREETSKSAGSPAATNINELYKGTLGLYPPARDLPTVDMRVERSYLFDQERISQDLVRDFAGLAMKYTPTDKVTLNYRPSYTVVTNRLSTLETQNLIQVGRVEYAESYFQNRVSFSTIYDVSYNELTTSASGTGTLDIVVAPFSGLSSINDLSGVGALAPNAAVMDGNLTAGAGINIGMPSIGGDTRQRNIGLDFSLAQEVNTLRVWVDRELPAAISGSFSWDVYTSADNQNWSLYTSVFPAPFGIFENRFEIVFSPVRTRYIKVVVKPLSPAVQGASGYPDIFVTELQAFSSKSAEQLRGKSTSSNQAYSFDGKALLLESANLYYKLSYFLSRTEPTSQQRWTLSNTLAASRRFNRVFSGSANAGREDFSAPMESGSAYIVNTSLDAVPLKTLRHNLAYSGRFEEGKSGRSKTNTLFLNNNAEVYAGVDMTVSGGVTIQDQATDVHVESTDLTAAANLQPHRKLNLNFFLSSGRAHTSRGGAPASVTWIRRTAESATYHPVETLYLVAGLSTESDQEKTKRSQNYAFNWSPFFGGALQFAFAYNESLESLHDSRVRTYGPSLTWKVTRTAYLATSYQATQIRSDDGKSDLKIFSSNLRAYF